MVRTFVPLVLLGFLVPTAVAQNKKARPMTVPLENAGVLHLSSSTWEPPTTENPDPGSTIGSVIYCNDASQGFFLATNHSAIVGDYGRVPGTLSPSPEIGTRPNYKINGFEFAYCTRKETGDFGYLIGFHSDVRPCSNKNLPPAVGSVVLTDLPGAPVTGELACWKVTVDLRWAEKEFCLAADGEGTWDNFVLSDSFGYSLFKLKGSGIGGGPVLAGDPLGNFGGAAIPGDGTVWHDNVGILPGTGLGTEDSYYVKEPNKNYAFCRDVINEPLTYGSFHLKLYADLNSPPCGNSFSTVIGETYCDPAVPNSNSYPGEIIATGSATVDDHDFTLWAANLPPEKNTGFFLMGDAQDLVLPPGSAGPLCVGGSGLERILPVHYTDELLGGFSQKVSSTGSWDPIHAGSSWNFQAWYRDGVGLSNLTNAVTVMFE